MRYVCADETATEKIVSGCFDEASNFDRQAISNMGGGKLEDHLDDAMEIIRVNPTCHEEMCNERARNGRSLGLGSPGRFQRTSECDFSLVYLKRGPFANPPTHCILCNQPHPVASKQPWNTVFLEAPASKYPR